MVFGSRMGRSSTVGSDTQVGMFGCKMLGRFTCGDRPSCEDLKSFFYEFVTFTSAMVSSKAPQK
jgi:hypothetical protein